MDAKEAVLDALSSALIGENYLGKKLFI